MPREQSAEQSGHVVGMVAITDCLRPLTEGFYDTALNEADDA
ncbi:hypothetical protein FHS27_006368 [Rhodopirellula rubra]|uniref:Uncharacterized protein n=1 Tax=Aporhodopirellula rubra TaxID=980271 RepID=A0A7W5E5B9_9BACT|nr:hypothetical protein [Aporhodopirellula rubra]MBB3210521.1 hypothetical protein [Aporhodopirellula rubra]